jgi:hypothetical protein
LNREKTVWNRQLGFAYIWDVPFRRLDDRIRELCTALTTVREYELPPFLSELKSLFRQRTGTLRNLAAAKQVRRIDEEPPEGEGRCQRLVHPDGRVFWSFTWSPPVREDSGPNSFIGSLPVLPTIGRTNGNGKASPEAGHNQPMVSAQRDSPDVRPTA